MVVVGLALAVGLLSRLFLRPFAAWLRRKGRVVANWRGRLLPTGVGLVPALFAAAGTLLALPGAWPVGFGALIMAFLGFLDDLFGERSSRGFGGHFGALLEGRPTTGQAKAIGGGLLALGVGFALERSLIPALFAGAVLALSANFVNLLDVRPGRALKGVLLFGLLLLPGEERRLLPCLLGAAAAVLPEDLREKVVLGDAGAMGLGFLLGAAVVLGREPIPLLWLLFLVVGHLYAERFSFTELIARTPWLAALDRLGTLTYREGACGTIEEAGRKRSSAERRER